MAQFIREDICHLHATLLNDDQQSGEYGLDVKDGLTVHDNNLLHFLHSLHFPLDFAVECARKQGSELLALSAAYVKCILDIHFCWCDLPSHDVVEFSWLYIERVRVLLQLLCNLIAVCLVHLPPSFTFLFVIVLHLAFSPSSTKWLLLRMFVAVHSFYGQVNVGTDTKAADPNCDLLGIRGGAPQPACTLPSPDVCLFSELVPPSEWRHTCAPSIRSFLAVVGRFSTFLRYQVM